VRAASVVGVRHRLAGLGSDDAFAWAVRDGAVMLAVADGVGTAPGSAAAALRACRAAVECPDVAGAVDAANRAAAGGGATTIVVAVVTEGGAVELARVGDSTGLVVEEDGSWQELFEPPDPERSDRATTALPAKDPAVESAAARLGPGAVLVLATDGIADPWRDGPTTVAPALAAALAARPGAPELLGAVDFSRHGCHDDRTMVAAWLR